MRRGASPQWQFLKSYWTASQTLCVLGGEEPGDLPEGQKQLQVAPVGSAPHLPAPQQRTLPREQKVSTTNSKCHKPGFSFVVTNGSEIAASSDPENLIHIGHVAAKKNPNTLLSGQMLVKLSEDSTRTASWARKHSLFKEFLMNRQGSKSIYGKLSSLLIPLQKRNVQSHL